MSRSLIKAGSTSSVAADRQIAKADIEVRRIDLRARVADGCSQPSPVGVASRPRGLHQRRMGNGLGHTQRVGIRGSARDAKFHHV